MPDQMVAVAHMGHSATRWTLRRRDEFRIGVGSERETVTAVKRLGELALLGAAMHDDDGERLLTFAWHELDRGRRIEELMHRQPAIASVYTPFRRAGRRSATLERCLVDPRWSAGHTSWPALAKYAAGVAMRAAGLWPAWSQNAALKQLLARHTGRRSANGLDAAVLAHLVMWRTAMGAEPDNLSAEEQIDLRTQLPLWLGGLTGAGLLDPLAEMIIANRCLHGPWPEEAWQALLAAQYADGAVPPFTASDAVDFDGLYHSTLVVALAATLATRVAPASDLFAAYGD